MCDSASLPEEAAACSPQRQEHELGAPGGLSLLGFLTWKAEAGTSQLCSPSQLCPPSHICSTFLQLLQAQPWLSDSHLKCFCNEHFSFPLFVSFPFFNSSFCFFFPISVTSQVTCQVPPWPFLQLVISHELLIHQVPPWISF